MNHKRVMQAYQLGHLMLTQMLNTFYCRFYLSIFKGFVTKVTVQMYTSVMNSESSIIFILGRAELAEFVFHHVTN